MKFPVVRLPLFLIWILIGVVSSRQSDDRFIVPSENKIGNGETVILPAENVRSAERPILLSRGSFAHGPRSSRLTPGTTALDLVRSMYSECLAEGSFSCVKPKLLAFLSASVDKEQIRLTRDMSIVRSSKSVDPAPEYLEQKSETVVPDAGEAERKKAVQLMMLDKVDDFLATHELYIRLPKELVSGNLVRFIPSTLLKNIPYEMKIPLASAENGRGRGLTKKIIMPFLLGLKFKATAVIPLALAFIALKTWKALTLGLLSVVLSGAMVIFKFTKPPRVVNYEVVHYQHHPAPPPPPPAVVEHPVAYDHHHPYRRSINAQLLAYGTQAQV